MTFAIFDNIFNVIKNYFI